MIIRCHGVNIETFPVLAPSPDNHSQILEFNNKYEAFKKTVLKKNLNVKRIV